MKAMDLTKISKNIFPAIVAMQGAAARIRSKNGGNVCDAGNVEPGESEPEMSGEEATRLYKYLDACVDVKINLASRIHGQMESLEHALEKFGEEIDDTFGEMRELLEVLEKVDTKEVNINDGSDKRRLLRDINDMKESIGFDVENLEMAMDYYSGMDSLLDELGRSFYSMKKYVKDI
jgi:hypothetical protein